jgi:hypothetical protein
VTTPDSGLPDTKPKADSLSSGPRTEHSRSAFRPRWDQLLSGLALAAAGLALWITGAITLPAAEAGLRLINLTANSDAGTHGQLTRIERTLRRMACSDSWTSQERKVKYPPDFTPGIAQVMEAQRIESLGLLDSALWLSSKAETVYDQALASLNDTTEDWALGRQLRDWAEFNSNRVAQKNAMTTSFQIQIKASRVASVIGRIIFLLGVIACGAAVVSPSPGRRDVDPSPPATPPKPVDDVVSDR